MCPPLLRRSGPTHRSAPTFSRGKGAARHVPETWGRTYTRDVGADLCVRPYCGDLGRHTGRPPHSVEIKEPPDMYPRRGGGPIPETWGRTYVSALTAAIWADTQVGPHIQSR